MKNKLILTSLLLQFAILSLAAQVTLKAYAPDVVEVGERFQVRYSVNTTEASDLHCPNFVGFEVLFGPSTSTQSSTTIINGKVSSNSSVTFTFTLLATDVGDFTINPASIQYDGQTIRSKSIRIKVEEGSGQQSQSANSRNPYRNSPQTNQNQNESVQSSKSNGKDVFMTATASRTKVFEQEAILVTYKLYTLLDIIRLQGSNPTLNGFQIHEVPLPGTKSFSPETYNGRRYNAVVWCQYVVFPQKTGKLVVPKIKFEATERRINRSMDPFEAFFNGVTATEVNHTIYAPEVAIDVSSLPTEPADFCGGVGDFKLTSSISTDSLKANDALTLKIKLTGSGNMKLIRTPEVKFDKDFEVYDPKVSENFKIAKDGLNGSKEFEYLAVPRSKGVYTIPPVTISYFDINSRSYKTLSTPEYTIKVAKGDGATSSSSVSYVSNQKDVEQLATDILHIKTGNVVLRQGEGTLFSSNWYWLTYLISAIAAIAIALLGRKRIRDNANVDVMKGKKANKVASKRLKKAAKLLSAHDKNNFYDEVMRALWGYISDKLNIPQASLNKDNVQAALTEKNVDPSLISQFIKCLDNCEFARYAPGDPNENMENLYHNAVEVISNMEAKIKRYKKPSNAQTLNTIVLLLIMSASSLCAVAQTKAEADKLYNDGNYSEAAKTYESILANKGTSFEIYYNLGNCYYKMDVLSYAILNYERAHLLNPSDASVNQNLAYVRGKIVDKAVPESEMFFVSWWHSMVNITSIDNWLIVGISAFVLMLIGLLAFGFLSSIGIRRVGFYGAIFCFVVVVLADLCAYSQHLSLINRDTAIVISPSVTVKSSPSDGSTELFVIHEGSKIHILDSSMKEWAEVKYEEGKQGWISKKSFEII